MPLRIFLQILPENLPISALRTLGNIPFRTTNEHTVKRERNTILIAEDEPDDAFLLHRAFRANNIDDPIHIVTDGEEALAYLHGEGKYADREQYEFPSFIISDLKMPRQDGFAILEALRSKPEWSVVPMIILSGSTDENDIERAYILCAKAYLVKPASFEDLRALIKKFHDFWSQCETPRVNKDGEKLPTNGEGKIGARYKADGALPQFSSNGLQFK